MVCCITHRPLWAAPRTGPLPPTAAADRRLPAANRYARFPAVAAQPARQQQQSKSSSSQAAGSGRSKARGRGRPSLVSKDSEEDIAASRQRLQTYLQQQGGISQAEAARLAGKLSATLGAAADQLVPVPLQWFVGRSMRPLKAAQLVAHICKASGSASFIRHWPTWQPLFDANWRLADSYQAAYQQHCKATEQKPLKGSESMAAMLSSQPSRYRLLRVPDLHGRVALLQQGQLALADREVGELIAGGLLLTGSAETAADAIQWLCSLAGSREAAISMLRAAPNLLNTKAATLDSKVAALQAAWAGVLQPEQLLQLLCKLGTTLSNSKPDGYGPTAAVLRSWFSQPSELLPVLQAAPQLLGASAATLQANERWFTGPPLSLSRSEFLARLRAAPQVFFQNFEEGRMQRKLAFLTEVGGVPLERATSASHLNYLKSGTSALAGRYFLLTGHGVPLARHEDGGIVLSYVTQGLPILLDLMRRHDGVGRNSAGRLPAGDDAALAYMRRWLAAWPESDSGRQWH